MQTASAVMGLISSVIAIITFIYQVVKVIREQKKNKSINESNANNNNIADSFNSISIDNSMNRIENHTYQVSIPSTTSPKEDNGLIYICLIIVFLPAIFKLMKTYQTIAVTVLILSALIVWLYNRYKLKAIFGLLQTKEFVVHYFICCLTAVIPIFSYFTLFAPMPFSECYKLVFNSKTGWLTRMVEFIQPVLYYLSVIFGLFFIALMIVDNIKVSRKFFKTQDICVLSENNKRRCACLFICLITVSGGLYWTCYGLFRFAQLMQPTVNQFLNG